MQRLQEIANKVTENEADYKKIANWNLYEQKRFTEKLLKKNNQGKKE